MSTITDAISGALLILSLIVIAASAMAIYSVLSDMRQIQLAQLHLSVKAAESQKQSYTPTTESPPRGRNGHASQPAAPLDRVRPAFF